MLYGADFDMNNKYIGKNMMQKAEKGKVLTKEQLVYRKQIYCTLVIKIDF